MEVVVVDDDSPDGTGQLVEEYARSIGPPAALTAITIGSAAGDYEKNSRGEAVNDRKDRKDRNYLIKVIHRPGKFGLISAILQGIRRSRGEYILVMDADFSHSPEVIPTMLNEIQNSGYDVVIGSR